MTYPNNFQNLSNKGFSTRPPFFNGIDYHIWKIKILEFLKFMGDDLLNIVVQGPYIPRKIIGHKLVEKELDEYDDFDKIMFSKNGCIFNYLLCSIDINIYNSVQMATNA